MREQLIDEEDTTPEHTLEPHQRIDQPERAISCGMWSRFAIVELLNKWLETRLKARRSLAARVPIGRLDEVTTSAAAHMRTQANFNLEGTSMLTVEPKCPNYD